MDDLASHLKNSEEIRRHIAEADALAARLGEHLKMNRKTLETLKEFCPPDRFTVEAPYHLRTKTVDREQISMREMIERQIKIISDTLGVLA